ncbi:hypothetical protein Q5752_006911 [Cryptotrichosporon argae]
MSQYLAVLLLELTVVVLENGGDSGSKALAEAMVELFIDIALDEPLDKPLPGFVTGYVLVVGHWVQPAFCHLCAISLTDPRYRASSSPPELVQTQSPHPGLRTTGSSVMAKKLDRQHRKYVWQAAHADDFREAVTPLVQRVDKDVESPCIGLSASGRPQHVDHWAPTRGEPDVEFRQSIKQRRLAGKANRPKSAVALSCEKN